jgi:hypothetical protein
MSELFFTMWAQNMGINVYHDIDVAFDIDKSHETFTSKAITGFLPLDGILQVLKRFSRPLELNSRTPLD